MTSTPRHLPEDAIRDILTSDESSIALAAKYGRAKQTISNIRRGINHRNVLPELPRWETVACHQCIHWHHRCGLSLPEAVSVGQAFANQCAAFSKQRVMG